MAGMMAYCLRSLKGSSDGLTVSLLTSMYTRREKFILKPLYSVLFASVATLSLIGCSSSDDDDTMAQELVSNTEKAIAVLGSLASGDSTVFADNVSADAYTQHNLSFPDGRDAVIDAMDAGALDGTTVELVRSFEDDDIVFTHAIYGGTWNGGTPQVAFDVFRFEDGLIVEHWDNLDAVQEDNDGTTQTDGTLTAIGTDAETSEATRALVATLSEALFLQGQWSSFGDYFDLDNYVQHSVGAGADSAGIVGIISSLPEGTPFYSSVEYIHAQGDFALMMSEGFPDAETGLADAYFDLFRVADGKVIEHWDVIQTIPAQSEWANTNGKW